MAVCMVCGTDYSVKGQMLNFGGTRYMVCNDCARKAKMDPARFEADLRKLGTTNPSFPECDACGRRHSNTCRTVKYDDVNFNVCGECIVPVEANPADFLAGKKGTEPIE